LDSTAVTAVTRSVCGELNTFALGFAERGFDERDHAALAASALGTRHHTLTISPSLFLEGVRDLTPLIDEPLADPAWVPTFLLSRFARTHVKTVLVGEGADELFAGYPTYLGGALAARYARLPAGVRRAVAAAAPALGAPLGNTTVRYLLRRFLEEADRPAPARHRAWTGCVDAARLAALATPGGPLALPPEPAALPARRSIASIPGSSGPRRCARCSRSTWSAAATTAASCGRSSSCSSGARVPASRERGAVEGRPRSVRRDDRAGRLRRALPVGLGLRVGREQQRGDGRVDGRGRGAGELPRPGRRDAGRVRQAARPRPPGRAPGGARPVHALRLPPRGGRGDGPLPHRACGGRALHLCRRRGQRRREPRGGRARAAHPGRAPGLPGPPGRHGLPVLPGAHRRCKVGGARAAQAPRAGDRGRACRPPPRRPFAPL